MSNLSESALAEVALEIRDLLGRKRLTTRHYEMAAAVIGAYERVRSEPVRRDLSREVEGEFFQSPYGECSGGICHD